jgi:CelD/BcsL family acetyltransferase involved in cellulose biosynthesis
MQIEIVKDFALFQKIKNEWNEMLVRSNFNVFFLTHEWLSTWWQNYGKGQELFIVLVKDKTRLVAAAPLMIKITKLGNMVFDRKLQFIAHDVSDYMDFIISEQPRLCFELIFDQIKKYARSWDWAELIYLSTAADNIDLWLNYEGKKWLMIKGIRDTSAIIDLKKYRDWEDYFKSLPKKVRDDVKRQANNIAKVGELSFEKVVSEDGIKGLLPEFFKLHQDRWAEQGSKSQFHDERWRNRYLALVEALSSSGRIELSCLKLNSDVVALHFGYVYAGCYYYYTPVFNLKYSKYSPGKLLLVNLLKDSFARGLEKFDLLRGSESYKYAWSNSTVNLYGMLIYKRSIKSIMICILKTQKYNLAKVPLFRNIKKRFLG